MNKKNSFKFRDRFCGIDWEKYIYNEYVIALKTIFDSTKITEHNTAYNCVRREYRTNIISTK